MTQDFKNGMEFAAHIADKCVNWYEGYSGAAGSRAAEEILARTENLNMEELAGFYIKRSGKINHTNTCATSIGPAQMPGPCDCTV